MDNQVTETKQSSQVQEKMKKQRYSYSKQMQHWEVGWNNDTEMEGEPNEEGEGNLLVQDSSPF